MPDSRGSTTGDLLFAITQYLFPVFDFTKSGVNPSLYLVLGWRPHKEKLSFVLADAIANF
ncbi:hypothetical protein [Cylindrospermum stagnale]|uniref:hypothetical protein n=1 Tax=Cylindrospermum stagnale TaxID=142864 RepID=UPI00059C5A31|nr:hypothetical protein [Cylindrospermum stagnale]